METTIEVAGLRKRFGPALALDGMTFAVSSGQITGFIGPNAPDAGHALIGGRPYVSPRDPLTHVGALLDAAALQPSRTARNHLLWLARSQGLGARRVDEVIALAGLRIAALLVSSHLMSELQASASHVMIVGRGKVIADTSVADLLATTSGDRVILRTAARTQAATVLANAGAEVAIKGPDVLTIAGLPAERAVVLLSEHAIPFSEVAAHRATLEEAYLELTKDAVEFRAAS